LTTRPGYRARSNGSECLPSSYPTSGGHLRAGPRLGLRDFHSARALQGAPLCAGSARPPGTHWPAPWRLRLFVCLRPGCSSRAGSWPRTLRSGFGAMSSPKLEAELWGIGLVRTIVFRKGKDAAEGFVQKCRELGYCCRPCLLVRSRSGRSLVAKEKDVDFAADVVGKCWPVRQEAGLLGQSHAWTVPQGMSAGKLSVPGRFLRDSEGVRSCCPRVPASWPRFRAGRFGMPA